MKGQLENQDVDGSIIFILKNKCVVWNCSDSRYGPVRAFLKAEVTLVVA